MINEKEAAALRHVKACRAFVLDMQVNPQDYEVRYFSALHSAKAELAHAERVYNNIKNVK